MVLTTQGSLQMRIVARIAVAAAVCGLTAPASAAVKDLRTMSDANGISEISFCSRPSPNAMGFPGHAFVAFSAPKPNGGRDFKAVGHTVADGASLPAVVISYFGGASVAGKQMEERYTALKQACLVVQVNHSDYEKAVTAARPTLTAIGIPAETAASVERYSLGNNDCIAFAEKVAAALRAAGLVVPARAATDTPAAWIGKLQSANN